MILPEFLWRDPLGEIFLAGHRICLHHIVQQFQDGASAEMILQHYPTLPLALVYKIISFYLENVEEVDRYVAGVRAEIEQQAAAPSRGPSIEELRRRLIDTHPTPSA